MKTDLQSLRDKHAAESHRFASGLADFLVDLATPDLVVETGFGVSSLFILSALDANARGNLISVDPSPWFADKVEHPRSTLILQKSHEVLPWLFSRVGPWDVFLHDSNHDVENMTYELEFGFACLKPGGWLFCDDYTWGGHGAWERFMKRHGLAALQLGSLMQVEKPATSGPMRGFSDVWEAHAFASALAVAHKVEAAERGLVTESAAFAK